MERRWKRPPGLRYTYKAWATAICPIINAIFIGIVQKLKANKLIDSVLVDINPWITTAKRTFVREGFVQHDETAIGTSDLIFPPNLQLGIQLFKAFTHAIAKCVWHPNIIELIPHLLQGFQVSIICTFGGFQSLF